ncbi:MAG: hypothetical protein LQ343_002006 [Gyalolechia ehrenbergii]|nr:MAG: hypothetical protein LQ343_002006 [Gyalolechia ehrenbergii]
MAAVSGIKSLPVKIVEQVVSLLAEEEPASIHEIRHEPSIELLDNDCKPLKNFSLVCRSLRSVVFPYLFQFIRLGFDVLLRETSKAETRLQGLYRLARFINKYNLADNVKGLTIFFPLHSEIRSQNRPDFVRTLVSFALKDVNPMSLTLIGSASLLGSLTFIHVTDGYTWAYGKRIHVLNLKQPSHLARRGKTFDVDVSCSLLRLRPWTEMFLNEGSSIKVYSVYEYYSKVPPSILNWHHERQWIETNPSLLPQLQHISFVCLFPLPDHAAELARALRCCPELISLSTQFTPAADARHDVLEDASWVGKANISDLWMETAQAYRKLATEIWSMGGSSRLRRWTTPDVKVSFDAILADVLIGRGWERKEPRVWERSCSESVD